MNGRTAHRKSIALAQALAALPAIHAAALVRVRRATTQEPVQIRLSQQLAEMIGRWERKLAQDAAEEP